MRIRNLESKDIPVLRRWHEESGFDYEFPDLTKFEAVRVLVDENDVPIQAAAARKTVECYLLLDSTWRNPRWRLEGFRQLHEDTCRQLEHKGYTDLHCWLPPQIERSFGRKLQNLFGWIKSHWSSYSRPLGINQ